MKICMLTTVHPPFDSRIFHKESKSLAKAGHKVTIVAPADSKSKKAVDGINIVTVKLPGSKALHPITMLRVFIEGLKQDCDLYHCHEPGSLFLCSILKLIKRKKLVYDAHEHYPSLIAEDKIFPGFSKKIIHGVVDVSEQIMGKYADCIITVNISLEDRFKNLNKTTIVYNVPSLKIFEASNPVKNPKTIIHTGTVGKKRGLDKLLVAIKETKVTIPKIKLLILGKILDTEEFKDWINSYIEKQQLQNNVEIINWVPHEEVVKYTENSEVGMILFQPTYYNNIIGLPNKLFEYMACKTAVIASDFPEIRKVIKEYNCGLLVDPENPDEIKNAIIQLLENPDKTKEMGLNGRLGVEEKYNWENMEKRLFKLYEELA